MPAQRKIAQVRLQRTLQRGLSKYGVEGVYPTWKTKNPGTQVTSSFNPIDTTTRDWYGPYWLDVEGAALLIQHWWRTLSNDRACYVTLHGDYMVDTSDRPPIVPRRNHQEATRALRTSFDLDD